jgi:hypothetical protein
MPTEFTAGLVIGPIDANSYHGQPNGGRKLFCPSHVLTLMEGARATWMVQACPPVGQGKPSHARIRPSDPARLLAAALLGYAALTRRELVNGWASLRAAVELDRVRGDVRVLPLDDNLADLVFEVCGPEMYGLLTTLPGSSIGDRELHLAAAQGLEVAAGARPAVHLAEQRG